MVLPEHSPFPNAKIQIFLIGFSLVAGYSVKVNFSGGDGWCNTTFIPHSSVRPAQHQST